MKKVILALFALATALAISPVASAQNYDFTYADSGVNASGWLTIGGAPSPSGNYATAGGLNWDDATFSLVPNPGGGLQLLGSAGYFPYLGGTYTFEYDDLFFPKATAPGTYLDVYGLLFANAAGTEFINIWSNGAGTHDSFWAVDGNKLIQQDSGNGSSTGDFAPTYVPEYSGLSMLILSALTLAGGFFFKAGQLGSFRHS
jgi:hypothetical protein